MALILVKNLTARLLSLLHTVAFLRHFFGRRFPYQKLFQ